MPLPAARQSLWNLSIFTIALLFALGIVQTTFAQEAPYFVTYDHHLEEPGNLEIETWTTLGVPRSGQNLFAAPYAEFEYGVTGRWTTEFYLEGQGTAGDGAVFTGWRFENRFKPFKREHGLNPVLYFEYESINEAKARDMAQAELAKYGITINCIQPGRIRSEQIDKRYPTEESRREFALAEIPMERFGEPEELGNLAIFLSSPLAGYITGTVIPVDGGMSRDDAMQNYVKQVEKLNRD